MITLSNNKINSNRKTTINNSSSKTNKKNNEIKAITKKKTTNAKSNNSQSSTNKKTPSNKNTTIKIDNKEKVVRKKVNTKINKEQNIETKKEFENQKSQNNKKINSIDKLESKIDLKANESIKNNNSKVLSQEQKDIKIKDDTKLKEELTNKIANNDIKSLDENVKKDKYKILKKIINIIIFIIKMIFIISFLFNIFILIKTNILPFKYLFTFILISSIVLIFDCLTEYILKNKIIRIISTVISLLFILIYIFIYIYLSKTDSFINGLFNHYQIETYYLAVLSDKEYNSIDDLNNLKIGTYYNNQESYDEIIKNINKSIKYNELKYDNLFALCDNLVNGTVDAILINDANKSIIEDLNDFGHVNLKYIYSFTVKTKANIISKSLDVTKEPFIVYITGIDTSDSINNVSRSDVNIIVTVNPNTKQILLVTIPRDYYVQLHGTTGRKDILTHAGLYGVDMSASTIEDLLDIDINYYIRLNFSTLIKAIDVIGGIEVYSDYTFNTYGYQFYQGYNLLNGEYALAFSRARKNFYTGDRQRGKNQLLVIEAIINKFSTSKTLLTNYLAILESLNGTFQTNIESSRIYSLVKMQLSDMGAWNIDGYSLDGISSQNYTYSLGDIVAFVMEPDYNTVNEAKEKINSLLNKN